MNHFRVVVGLEMDAKEVDKGSTSGPSLRFTIGKPAHSVYQLELYENHEARPNNCAYAGFVK